MSLLCHFYCDMVKSMLQKKMATLREREKYVFGIKDRLFVATEKQIWLFFRETK